MTRHTILDVPLEGNVVREVDFGGVHVRGALSPFDFPERVKLSVTDGTPRMMTVDFVYTMVPEEEVEVRKTDGDQLHVGKHSGRILRLVVTLPAGAEHLKLEVEIGPALRALEDSARRLSAKERPPRRLAHYAMVADMLPWLDRKVRETMGVDPPAYSY